MSRSTRAELTRQLKELIATRAQMDAVIRALQRLLRDRRQPTKAWAGQLGRGVTRRRGITDAILRIVGDSPGIRARDLVVRLRAAGYADRGGTSLYNGVFPLISRLVTTGRLTRDGFGGYVVSGPGRSAASTTAGADDRVSARQRPRPAAEEQAS